MPTGSWVRTKLPRSRCARNAASTLRPHVSVDPDAPDGPKQMLPSQLHHELIMAIVEPGVPGAAIFRAQTTGPFPRGRSGAQLHSAPERVPAARPLRPSARASFAPRSLRGVCSAQGERRAGAGDLDPALVRIELLRISARENHEGAGGMPLAVDVANRILVPEPVRRHEVGEPHPAHVVAVLVVLDRITDLSRPEGARRVL